MTGGRRRPGKMMASPPHKLVSPEGVLHLVPDDKRTKIDFSKAHDLRNEYLGKHIRGESKY